METPVKQVQPATIKKYIMVPFAMGNIQTIESKVRIAQMIPTDTMIPKNAPSTGHLTFEELRENDIILIPVIASSPNRLVFSRRRVDQVYDEVNFETSSIDILEIGDPELEDCRPYIESFYNSNSFKVIQTNEIGATNDN